MDPQATSSPVLPRFVPPSRKDPKPTTSTALVAKILGDIHLKVREGATISSANSTISEISETPETQRAGPSAPLPRPDGLTAEQAARLLPAFIIPIPAVPERSTKSRVVNEWIHFGRPCKTVADDFGFTAVLPFFGAGLKVRTRTQANKPGVYIVSVWQGEHLIIINLPRIYCETSKTWYVDLDDDTLTIEWVPDTSEAEFLALRPPRNALNYRIDFDEDSEVDAESILEGENGRPIVQTPQDFGYMRDADYLSNPFTTGHPQQDRGMSKEEKKLLKKTLDHSTTRDLAIAAKEAKKQRKHLEALKKDQEQAEGAPLLLLSKAPQAPTATEGNIIPSKRQKRRAKEQARKRAKLAEKAAREEGRQAARAKAASALASPSLTPKKPTTFRRRFSSSVSSVFMMPATKKQKQRKSSLSASHTFDIPLETLAPLSPPETTMPAGVPSLPSTPGVPVIITCGPSALPPAPKLKTVKKTLADEEEYDLRGLINTGFLNFTPSEVRQVTSEEDRSPRPVTKPAKLVARDEVIMKRGPDGKSRLRTVSDLAVPSTALVHPRERSYSNVPMQTRTPVEPVEVEVDAQDKVATYMASLHSSQQRAENIPLAEFKKPEEAVTRPGRSVTFGTHLTVPPREDGYPREPRRFGRPVGEAFPIVGFGFGRKKSNSEGEASRKN